jgi:hypothetical protein
LITNPAIGILTESNIYLAKIREFNSSYDDYHLIYHHQNHVYTLQSFASNYLLHRIYICSPSTLYTLDLRIGANIVPFSPIDETPCRSSLTYLPGDSTLLWTLRRSIIQLDFEDMTREFLWNSTSTIIDMIYNNTIDDNYAIFYVSITIADHQSSVLYCRTDRRLRHIYPFQSCLFIDSSFHQVITLAIDGNHLYVADRIEQRIYVLTLLPGGLLTKKEVLPLNTSTVADIKSMFVYNGYLVWATTSGHVRIVSLTTMRVRTIFWFDEQIQTIRLVSFSDWPNRTTTTVSTTATTTTTTITTTTKQSTTTSLTSTTSLSTTKSSISSTTASEQIDTTTDINDSNPWKATTYATSIVLGIALFLCAAMITCVLLNYRLGRVVPNSFTNIFHVLRNRPVSSASAPLPNTTLTLSMS